MTELGPEVHGQSRRESSIRTLGLVIFGCSRDIRRDGLDRNLLPVSEVIPAGDPEPDGTEDAGREARPSRCRIAFRAESGDGSRQGARTPPVQRGRGFAKGHLLRAGDRCPARGQCRSCRQGRDRPVAGPGQREDPASDRPGHAPARREDPLGHGRPRAELPERPGSLSSSGASACGAYRYPMPGSATSRTSISSPITVTRGSGTPSRQA